MDNLTKEQTERLEIMQALIDAGLWIENDEDQAIIDSMDEGA